MCSSVCASAAVSECIAIILIVFLLCSANEFHYSSPARRVGLKLWLQRQKHFHRDPPGHDFHLNYKRRHYVRGVAAKWMFPPTNALLGLQFHPSIMLAF
jgi:hypothetical protein